MNDIRKEMEFLLNINNLLKFNNIKLINKAMSLQKKNINFFDEFNELTKFLEKSKEYILKYQKIKLNMDILFDNITKKEKRIFVDYFIKKLKQKILLIN